MTTFRGTWGTNMFLFLFFRAHHEYESKKISVRREAYLFYFPPSLFKDQAKLFVLCDDITYFTLPLDMAIPGY